MLKEEISIDMLLLICFNYILENLSEKFLETKSQLLEVIECIIYENDESTQQDKKRGNLILVNHYKDELKEIHKNLNNENAKFLSSLLNKTLKNFHNIDDLDTYLTLIYSFKEVLKNIKNENFEFRSLFKKNFFEFIAPILEQEKQHVINSLDNETWASLSDNLPPIIQKKINILFYKSFDENKKILNLKILKNIFSLDYSDIIQEEVMENKKLKEDLNEIINNTTNTSYLNNSETANANIDDNIPQKESEEISGGNSLNNANPNVNAKNTDVKDTGGLSSQQSLQVKNFIEIDVNKYKIMCSTVNLINSIFESYKILLICDESLMPHICDSICSNLTKFLEINNEMVLDGEGVRKGKLKAIYQKEISMVSSNTLIIKKIVGLFSGNHLLSPIFTDLNKLIEKNLSSCKIKISELFQQM